MANLKKFPTFLDLQLFAEGAGGSAGTGAGDGSGTGAEGKTGVNATAAVSQGKGVKQSPLANVVYGVQANKAEAKSTEQKAADTPPAAEVVKEEDRAAKFDELIKGEYKDLYDAKVSDTVRSRLKGRADSEEKLSALKPTLELLSKKYGVDATDVKALTKAIEEDDSYYEAEALAKGLTVEQFKEFNKLKRDSDEFKKLTDEQKRRDAAGKQYAEWVKQAEGVKSVYPSFDLKSELQNKQFVQLLGSNVDVRTAYEVIHKDEIIAGAMQFAAKKAEEKVTNRVISGSQRPNENGTSSQGAAVYKSDVSQLSKADLAEINKRVARGEKISFG